MSAWFSGWLLHPAMILGTLAVASPILIHLLSRRRFRRVQWAAIEFLLQAHRKNRRRVQLEQWILLALRCLALLLLAMAMARPFVRPGLAATLLGGGGRGERIVLLDDSFSMEYRAGPTSVFDRAKAAVRQLAEWLAEESPGDAFTLLAASRPTQPLIALAMADEADGAAFRDALAAVTPSRSPAHPERALAAVAELLGRRPNPMDVTVYLISDFQQSDWGARRGDEKTPPGRDGDPSGRFADVVATLRQTAQRFAGLRIVLIDVSAERPRNVAITGLTPLTPQIVAGVGARIQLEVSNFSDEELRNVELSVAASDQALPPPLIPRIGPRETVREPVEVIMPRPGSDYLRVALAGEAAASAPAGADAPAALTGQELTCDDRRYCALHVSDAVRVLLVDGDPNPEPYLDEVHLFKTALRPEGRIFSGNEVRVVEESELETLDLSPFHVIVLANVYRLSDAARATVERYVASGGGLLISAGNQLDPTVCNESLFAGGTGFLPGELRESVAFPADDNEPGVAMASWDESHPVFRAFHDSAAQLLRRIRFARVMPLDPHDPPAASHPADGASSRPAPRAAVIARLADPEGTPLLTERPHGAGRVIFYGSTIDLDWNSWARDPSYLPFVLELISALARSSAATGDVAVDAPIRLPIDLNAYRPRVTLTPPAATDAPAELDAQPEPEGGFAVTWTDTRQPGPYRFDLVTGDGVRESTFAVVNLDPAESDLTPAGRATLLAALSGLQVEYVRGEVISRGNFEAARRELWWPLVLAVVGVLLLEHTLAWRFGTGGGRRA